MLFVGTGVLGPQSLSAQRLRAETPGGRGQLDAGRGKAQQGPHLIRLPDRRDHQQRRPVLFLYRFGLQEKMVLHNAYLGQPREYGRQSG